MTISVKVSAVRHSVAPAFARNESTTMIVNVGHHDLTSTRDYARAIIHVSRNLHVTSRVARILLEGIAHGERTLTMDVTNLYKDLDVIGMSARVDIEPITPEWAALGPIGFTCSTTITRPDGSHVTYATTYAEPTVTLPSGDTVRAYQAGDWS